MLTITAFRLTFIFRDVNKKRDHIVVSLSCIISGSIHVKLTFGISLYDVLDPLVGIEKIGYR